MHLTTLVGILEREHPGGLDNTSTRGKLARLYSEQGCHDDARREAERALAEGVAADLEADLRRIVAKTPRR